MKMNELPTRIIHAHGEVWECPRYINPNKSGWNVRIMRKHEPKLNIQINNANYTCAEDAFMAAKGELALVIGKYIHPDFLNTHYVDIPAINFCKQRVRNGKPVANHNITANITLLGASSKTRPILHSIYVGRMHSLTQAQVDKAVKKLMGVRFWAIRMKQEYGRKSLLVKTIPSYCDDYIPLEFSLPKYKLQDILNK